LPAIFKGFRLTRTMVRCYYSAVSLNLQENKAQTASRRKGGLSLNKGDFIGKIAKDVGLTKSQAESAFNSLISGITVSLKKGQKVTIVGFGTFSVARRKARVGRNPQTGAPIKIAAHKVPKFAAGSDLKKAVK
jgi:DNA-binding protein HU-beta